MKLVPSVKLEDDISEVIRVTKDISGEAATDRCLASRDAGRSYEKVGVDTFSTLVNLGVPGRARGGSPPSATDAT
eukprot:10962360-Heterocapsa_arctica.AAC.1